MGSLVGKSSRRSGQGPGLGLQDWGCGTGAAGTGRRGRRAGLRRVSWSVQAAVKNHHRLGEMTEISRSRCWRLGSLRSRQTPRLVRPCFLATAGPVLPGCSGGRAVRELAGASVIRALIPSLRALPS